MEDYKKLVNRLREEPKDSRKAVLSIYDLCVDAATAIENLSHRLDMAQGERDAVTRRMIELEQDVCRLKSRLSAYEDTGLEPEEIKNALDVNDIIPEINVTVDHIRDLLQAEQDGRLVVLPCKVGDTVWLLKKKCKYAGEDNDPWCSCDQYWDNVYHKHMWGCAGKDDEGKQFDCEKRDIEWYAQQIEYSLVLYSHNIVLGKNLFLTREDAEAALKGGDG